MIQKAFLSLTSGDKHTSLLKNNNNKSHCFSNKCNLQKYLLYQCSLGKPVLTLKEFFRTVPRSNSPSIALIGNTGCQFVSFGYSFAIRTLHDFNSH